ncbi:hypothetical protein SEA_JEMERALD_14 [Microbacterium phage Jemerald]|nr:hypothetical protein SEA_JUICER_14 [Microbacterium phage Juicer]WNO27253.1 hypothetical protein SEA_JEMERALD_14 [Microbacterium phage Jemerald]
MTGIKPSSHGIVVEHKESGVRYAVSDRNYNEKIHRKVRDLRPGETVLGYTPKRPGALVEAEGSGAGSPDAAGTQAVSPQTSGEDKTEGANPGTQEKKGK